MTEYQRGFQDGWNAKLRGIGTTISKVEKIQQVTCLYFKTNMDQMKTKRRMREIVYPRQVLTYLLMRKTSMGCTAVARIFNQDHTSVLNSVHTILDLMFTNEEVRADVHLLMEQIEGTIENKLMAV